jgi:hypothetical protein
MGLDPKYTIKGGDLVSFSRDIWKCLKDSGLDTIAYLPDPTTNDMVNVIENYACFTTDSAKLEHGALHPYFDTYDLKNDRDATWMFLDSIDPDIKEYIERKMEDDTGFAEVFIMFIDRIKSGSSTHFEALHALIKKQHPSMYAGQNL